jgi:hypothetical protein
MENYGLVLEHQDGSRYYIGEGYISPSGFLVRLAKNKEEFDQILEEAIVARDTSSDIVKPKIKLFGPILS